MTNIDFEPFTENAGWKGPGKDRVEILSVIVYTLNKDIEELTQRVLDLEDKVGLIPKLSPIPNNGHPTKYVRYSCEVPGHTPVNERMCANSYNRGIAEICDKVKRIEETPQVEDTEVGTSLLPRISNPCSMN